jgi:hypothetical protein
MVAPFSRWSAGCALDAAELGLQSSVSRHCGCLRQRQDCSFGLARRSLLAHVVIDARSSILSNVIDSKKASQTHQPVVQPAAVSVRLRESPTTLREDGLLRGFSSPAS